MITCVMLRNCIYWLRFQKTLHSDMWIVRYDNKFTLVISIISAQWFKWAKVYDDQPVFIEHPAFQKDTVLFYKAHGTLKQLYLKSRISWVKTVLLIRNNFPSNDWCFFRTKCSNIYIYIIWQFINMNTLLNLSNYTVIAVGRITEGHRLCFL